MVSRFGVTPPISGRVVGYLSVALLLIVMSGCAWCPACFQQQDEPPPPPPVKNMLVYWDPHVHSSPDPLHNGKPLPGMACRVYMFGEGKSQMVDATGPITIDLYDVSAVPTGGAEIKLVSVNYDPVSLKQFKRQDRVGWGYTLFVPWETFRPDVKAVRMQVAYQPAKGLPYYDQSEVISLKPAVSPNIHGSNQQIMPAAHTK